MATSTRMAPCLLIAASWFLASCYEDESARAYGAADRIWTLVELDGARFKATATLRFPEPGKITGKAPCNQYFATMTAPYPWFEATAIGSTKMACPELQAESVYLTALAEMTQSEVSGNVLILRNEQGRELFFKAPG